MESNSGAYVIGRSTLEQYVYQSCERGTSMLNWLSLCRGRHPFSDYLGKVRWPPCETAATVSRIDVWRSPSWRLATGNWCQYNATIHVKRIFSFEAANCSRYHHFSSFINEVAISFNRRMYVYDYLWVSRARHALRVFVILTSGCNCRCVLEVYLK